MLVFAGGILVEPKLTLQTDPVQWVNPHSQVIHDINAVESGTGSANELGVFVQAPNVFADDVVRSVDLFTTAQLKLNADKLVTATSIVASVSDLINDVPGANHVVPTGTEVHDAYLVSGPAIQTSSTTPNARAMNIVFRTGTPARASLALDKQATLVNTMRGQLKPEGTNTVFKGVTYRGTLPPGVTATPSGLAVVGVGLLNNLESNRVLLTYLAIIFVGLFLAIRLRSLVRSLLSLVPVLIAVGAASLVAYVLHLKLSPLTAVGGPLVVAVCTEFTSLILLRFVEERGKGYATQGGGGPHRLAHRSGLHRVGPHRHLGCGRDRHLVHAPAARLRHRGGHERGRGAAERVDLPAAHAGVGGLGRAQLGVAPPGAGFVADHQGDGGATRRARPASPSAEDRAGPRSVLVPTRHFGGLVT